MPTQQYEPCMDVLFINGCDPAIVPHPPRYRIAHQQEQLIANNIDSNKVFYTNLSLDQVRNYRVFIFFRCPYTPVIGEFIKLAKKLHKTVLYDIDDLVIDTKYTDLIPYVRELPQKEKAAYDDFVVKMGKTLSLCDAAITTTERLATELRKYVPEVFINRNTASELMYRFSEEAIKEREIEKELEAERLAAQGRQHRKRGKKNKQPAEKKVRIGYFSGSITHNSDFLMIVPALVRILKQHSEAELHVVGELDLPKALRPYSNRIIKHEFVSWDHLPKLIASVDINIAPIEKTIFNEAKSENKWVEAALVKVPTIASDFGAFRQMIRNNETGILCDTMEDWYQALHRLVSDTLERDRLAENAYQFCKQHCLSFYTGFPLAKFIRSQMTPNVAMMLPSLGLSGGMMVALRHTGFLYDCGYDTFIICEEPGTGWLEYEKYRFPVVSRNHHHISLHIDKAVATMWLTLQFLEMYPHIRERYYLVQNFEPDFYQPDSFLRIQANQTYSPSHPTNFITISRWCQDWLWNVYEQKSAYAPNGIDTAGFRAYRREMTGKIRILIEGDCGVYYKNVDESFRIADRLDPERFEIWYMSYNAEPKPEYRVDRFLHKVPYEKVYEVYVQCDILLKSSILESFSYPPLEMMASGGFAVVAPNDGNREYLKDGENCLMYPQGDLSAAVRAIESICNDEQLRNRLYEGGLRTVHSRDWAAMKDQILSLYHADNMIKKRGRESSEG